MRTRRHLARLALMLVALLALGAGGGANAAGGVAAHPRQARPVVNMRYVYDQLFTMSTSYIYRVSGADGPPGDPRSPHNLPATINGWQEFFQHWKQQMTSPQVMGDLARALSVRDHFFQLPFMPYQSDVAEVTIPGAVCPGQRVLLGSHPDSTPVNGSRLVNLINAGKLNPDGLNRIFHSNLGNGSAYDATSGVTLTMGELQALLRWYEANGTWPDRTIKVALFDAEETGLNGSQYYASHLLPTGPQGQYAMVANMDQNGLEYPAFHFGTDHYLNSLVDGGVGPWYTNINASPLQPNSIYPATSPAWANIQRNMPAIIAFRQALQDSVSAAFHVLGAKYHDQVPLEDPLTIAQFAPSDPTPRTMPAYSDADQQRFSPVQDDALGRTDQVPFVSQGIPGYGVLGAFDTTANENPYPSFYTDAEKLPIFDYAGYDTTRDDIFHLNQWASGMPHGPGGVADPTQELLRGLELPATWTSYLVAQNAYGGVAARPERPVAYFETDPVNPTTTTVDFDGAFSVPAGGGRLTYVWDFGDGTVGVGAHVTHTYARPMWADAKLIVVDGSGRIGAYRQAVNVASAPGAAPATPACGTVTGGEAQHVLAAAHAHHLIG